MTESQQTSARIAAMEEEAAYLRVQLERSKQENTLLRRRILEIKEAVGKALTREDGEL